MKRFYYTPIVLILLVMLPLFAFSGCNTEKKIAESYIAESLLSRKNLKVRPKASERDVNLIEAEKGAVNLQKTSSEDFSQKAYQSHKPIQEETKVQDEKISNEPNCTDLKVFGIPLNASLQEVVSACEKCEIEVFDGLIDKKDFAKNLRNAITITYDEWHISSAEKERALKLLEEDKIKSFDVTYKGKEHVAYPAALVHLLGAGYPVLEEHYDMYNSQFMLDCRKLPDYMTAQGISRMQVFFATFHQNEPRSFLISIRFNSFGSGGEELNTILARKYGSPLLHSHSGGSRLIYPKMVDVIERGNALDPLGPVYVTRPFLVYKTSWSNYTGFGVCSIDVLEWNCANTKVLLASRATREFEEREPQERMPNVLNYVYMPTIEPLYNMYEKLLSASEETEAKMVEKGKKGF